MSFYTQDTSPTHHPDTENHLNPDPRPKPDCNTFGLTPAGWFRDTSSTHR